MSSLNPLRNYRSAGLIVVLALPFSSVLVMAQKYQITKFYIPPPPKNRPGTSASGINLQGMVVGEYGFSEGELTYDRGFLRLPDGTLQYPIIDPNDPDGRATYATGINGSGVISGYYFASQEHGFLLNNGNFTDVSEIDGGRTRIYSINDSGDFCGAFGDRDPPQHGFISTGGNLTQVDVPDESVTWVTALGSDGAAVGEAFPGSLPMQSHSFAARTARCIRLRPKGPAPSAQGRQGSTRRHS